MFVFWVKKNGPQLRAVFCYRPSTLPVTICLQHLLSEMPATADFNVSLLS
jgi:hypothetical protein